MNIYRLVFSEVNLAGRRLTKSPGFAAVAIFALALGIGASTAIFSIVNRVVLEPLPYIDADRLVQIWEDYKGDGTGQNTVSGGVARSWQEQSTTLEALAAANRISSNLTGGTQPERLAGLQVSPSYLHLLRLSPAHGRDFLPDEGQAGKSNVIVLTDAGWKKYFGGRDDIIGQTVTLSNMPITIVGVLGATDRVTTEVDFLQPFDYGTPGWSTAFAGHNLSVIGRLKPAATPSALRIEMAVITERIRGNFPDFKRKWGVTVVPLHEQVTGNLRPQLFLLFGATLSVLLIGCANVAGLLLARAVARGKEMALRLALGASRGSIIRQILIENLVLSFAGGAVGLILTFWSINVFRQWRPPDLAPGVAVYVDGRALAFAIAATILAGVGAGLAPAWRLAQSQYVQLKGGAGAVIGGQARARGALIVGQIALSFILLSGAGLLLRSFLRLEAVPIGFEPAGLLAADLTLDSDSFRDAGKRSVYLDQIEQKVRAVPGVEAVGLAAYLPLQDSDTEFISPDGSTSQVIASVNFISDGYLGAMQIPLLKGRPLSAVDNQPNAPPTMVLDENLAARLFPNQEPVGRRASFFGRSYEIVGVTGNVRVRGIEQEAVPEIYLPEARAFGFDRSLVVRTKLPPASLARAVRMAILDAAPDQPVSNERTYTHIVAQQVTTRRLMLGVVSLFAVVALTLAALGLYGLIAFSVNSRIRDLGVRAALGASRKNILFLVYSEAIKLTSIGLLFGLVGGFFLTRLVARFLFGISATDPLTLAAVIIILGAVALLACLLPARRATMVDPIVVIRAE